MSKQWKWTLAVAVLTALVVAAPQAKDDPGADAGALTPERNLLGVQVDRDARGGPVVTLRTDGPVEFESFVLDGPDRLVVDLPGCVSRLSGGDRTVDAAGVIRVRTAQYQKHPDPVARVVFDLAGPVSYEIEQVGDSLVVEFDRPTTSLAVAANDTPAPLEGDSLDRLIDELVTRADLPADEQPEPVEDPADTIAQAHAETAPGPGRSVEPSAIEQLLQAPAFAAEAEQSPAPPAGGDAFQTRQIVTDAVAYRGKRISLNLVDADLKQVFRLFHEISGLNFVLDPDVAGRVTIVLDQVPWDQALDIILKNNSLDKVLEGNVLRIAATQKLAREAASRKQLKDAAELEVEPITLTRTLSYAKAADVQRVLREGGILSSRGQVIVDERTNTLIISDVPKKVKPVDELLSTLDAETPQVVIEARIVETSRVFSQDFGVRWGFEAIADASRGTATNMTFPHNASARYGLNLIPEGGLSTLAFSLSNVVDSFTLDIALDALESEGHGRILSSPKIATQNNERAEIEQGTRIPIVNTTATEINVEFVSASLLMIVTPQITAEGTIILDVIVENNSPDFNNTSGGIPTINTQRAQTKVLIEDGGTTVIGGIFVVNEGESELGVPWFRKIPVFGWLFKSRSITQENRELLIFITPKIVQIS